MGTAALGKDGRIQPVERWEAGLYISHFWFFINIVYFYL